MIMSYENFKLVRILDKGEVPPSRVGHAIVHNKEGDHEQPGTRDLKVNGEAKD